MGYVNRKVKEILNADKDIMKIKQILCGMFAAIQMDSSVREDFDKELERLYHNQI